MNGSGTNGGGATSGNASSGNANGAGTNGGRANAGKGGEETTEPDPAAGADGADAAAGAAGAAGGAPCDEKGLRCAPGEPACDPVLGKLGTCGACGVVTNVDTAGVDCVRLLASDKESNGVCAVLGSDRLECFPEAFQVQKTTLPGDTMEVLLPDDYVNGSQVMPCFRDSQDRYSCTQEACDGRVVVGDHGLCSLCNGELLCHDLFSEPPVVQQPIDISLSDGYVFVLSPLGVHALGQVQTPPDWHGAPAHVLVDHQSAGCAISDQGEMACWLTFSEGLQAATWPGKFKKVIGTTLPRACALDDARQLHCGNVFEELPPTPYGDADTIDFVASAYIVCSLSVAGHVKCWNDATGEAKNLAAGW